MNIIIHIHTHTHNYRSKYKNNFIQKKNFWCNKLKSEQRIGPHTEFIQSCIIGHMLGDGHLEFRSGSTRLTLHLGLPNREYIAWLFDIYIQNGYCTSKELKFKKQIGKEGKVHFSTKISTFSFKSFNWLHELFYESIYDENTNNKITYKKKIPQNIINYLTPQTLAIWLMDDGSKHNSGFLLHTNSFTLEENYILQDAFLKRYNIKTTLHKKGSNFIMYISSKEAKSLKYIVEPYVHKSMLYKLQNL